MAEVKIEYYPLICECGGGQCTMCNVMDECDYDGVNCEFLGEWSDKLNVVVKNVKNFEWMQPDAWFNWKIKLGNTKYYSQTTSLKRLTVDGEIIYQEQSVLAPLGRFKDIKT